MSGGGSPALYGRHPVLELLRRGGRRVEEVLVLREGRGSALGEIESLAAGHGVRVSYRTRQQLTAIAGSPHHQGVVARVAEVGYAALEDLLAIPAQRGEPAFFLALDQVQDPRNLGALLRTAEAVGVHGVVIAKHRAAGLSGGTAKAAMGAIEFLPVARETNLTAALERFKKQRVWVIGSVPKGGTVVWEADLTGPICVVIGGEEKGLRPLVARTCDFLVTLPMRGRIGSLNAAAAGAVLCYEVLRQRGSPKQNS
ncbi:MAG: 23S rRNA (guanosine(2251)-2'-O)-methyltransferase RlmB [Candidatus Rokubacteria bacterium]|nr:23S rRNA (guanosine(2251)-2'-O)-methyltransferase RlmB [Candidatus Rokubacteria bacterium]